MKKLIPVIIAIALIGVVVAVNFGGQIYQKYSYGQDMADLNDYFQIFGSEDVPIILQDARIDEKATYIDETIYLDIDTVENYFTERFYLDYNEGLLLYTNAVTTIRTAVGSDTYTEAGNDYSLGYPLSLIKDDKLYIAIDYLKHFVNFSYELFTEPNRMQVYTEWSTKEMATLKSDTDVRWLGGVKSDILTSVKEGDKVEVLEVMDTWTKVKTQDAFIGYVENFRLNDAKTEVEKPVTEVPELEYTSLTHDYKINLTWHYMEWPQDGADLKTALANTKALNVVSPTWYYLTDNEGGFKSLANENYVTTAHKMGLEVWALISNFHSGYDVSLEEVLGYTSKREKLVADLVDTTASYGADGINIDFENVPFSCSTHYVQFIRELGLACHEKGLILSVDNYVPTEYTAHYNRGQQQFFADYIIVMGYDEHYQGSPTAGSVASMDWMSAGIVNTLKYVPANKVINAIPFYTRCWMTEGGVLTSEAITMETSQNFLKKNNLTTTFDADTKQNYVEATLGKILYQIWYEDATSIATRLNVMQMNGIAGVASWRVGMETPDVWEIISVYMQQ